MAGKRPVNKGSFGGDLDELVKQFTPERLPSEAEEPVVKGSKAGPTRPPNVNGLLFQHKPD
jgi:hypothetical protein